MPIVLKSGSLNLLEPSGSVQVCNGIALPLPLTSVGGPFVKSKVKLIYIAGILCVHYVDNERGQRHVLPLTSEIL